MVHIRRALDPGAALLVDHLSLPGEALLPHWRLTRVQWFMHNFTVLLEPPLPHRRLGSVQSLKALDELQGKLASLRATLRFLEARGEDVALSLEGWQGALDQDRLESLC